MGLSLLTQVGFDERADRQAAELSFALDNWVRGADGRLVAQQVMSIVGGEFSEIGEVTYLGGGRTRPVDRYRDAEEARQRMVIGVIAGLAGLVLLACTLLPLSNLRSATRRRRKDREMRI